MNLQCQSTSGRLYYPLRKNIKIILIVVYMIIMTNGLGFFGWDLSVGKNITYIFYFATLSIGGYYLISNKKAVPFRNLFLAFFVIPIVSAYVSSVFYNYSLKIQWGSFALSFGFMTYFCLYYFRVSKKTLISAMIIFSLITFVIQLYQVMFPDGALFGRGNLAEYGITSIQDLKGVIAETDRGLARFSVGLNKLQMFMLFLFLYKFTQKQSWFNIVMIVVFLSSIFFYQTRQLMVACYVVFILALIGSLHSVTKGKGKIFFIFFIGMCVIGYYFDDIFGSIIEYSKDNTYSTDIRSEAMPFFFNKSIDGFFTITGHGYNPVMFAWGPSKGYFPSDVGYAGEMYIHGIVWIICFLYVIYRMIIRDRKRLSPVIKNTIYASLIMSPYIYPITQGIESIFFSFLVYLAYGPRQSDVDAI